MAISSEILNYSALAVIDFLEYVTVIFAKKQYTYIIGNS